MTHSQTFGSSGCSIERGGGCGGSGSGEGLYESHRDVSGEGEERRDWGARGRSVLKPCPDEAGARQAAEDAAHGGWAEVGVHVEFDDVLAALLPNLRTTACCVQLSVVLTLELARPAVAAAASRALTAASGLLA